MDDVRDVVLLDQVSVPLAVCHVQLLVLAAQVLALLCQIRSDHVGSSYILDQCSGQCLSDLSSASSDKEPLLALNAPGVSNRDLSNLPTLSLPTRTLFWLLWQPQLFET